MANAHVMDIRLRLVFDAGFKDGKPVFKRRTYSRVRSGATADQLFYTGSALASLSQHNLLDIDRLETASILEV
ncbi:DUF1659 domain-containing protein [Jeotgalibacillus sp. R-1-5s-1]|uniref:DUF1659 domain-containing protein n=1 Tax=Jeotgalibacillus sp. R-1-5s-1 TaxID=2555897 RepID=UPI00106C014D|nr:DUF1659 domain-containing protein [Jeotgalibacillus sp. R-1-5s-1]TFD99670.1 DUF1659 domain-containing protein [Jeotgalibacillus sp. R-1-5s-1]